MIKNYRKRFVLSNMLLSGTVLLIVFIILGVTNYRQECRSLENTMSIILRPWNSQYLGNSFDSSSEPSTNAPKQSGDMPDPKQPKEPYSRKNDAPKHEESISRDDYELFTTVIYRPDTGKISYLSGEDSIDDDLVEAAVYQVTKEYKSFGRLSEYGLIYYKEKTHNEIKIALIDASYLAVKAAKKILLLACAFFLSIGAILIISIRLSSLAARPLEQAIEMERNFVADISHDLKTPITIVLANNGIIKANKKAKIEDQMQWIESTEEAAKNMMELVNEMLTLSEVESLGKKVERYSVSLSSVCEKCTLQLESIAYEQNVEIISDISENIDILSTNEYTERICSGLIENALKYSSANGNIDVKVYKDKKSAVLSVRNTGSYINENDLPHIFERFYRADKTRSQTKGHGLGLPIIKQMTELVGGSIDVESSPDEGTVFTVRFDMP